MTIRTYIGSCHCGDVRFEADLDLAEGSVKCNCSICTRIRNWSAKLKSDAFRLLSDADAVVDYQFGTGSVHWPFCRRCGVRSYSHRDLSQGGGKVYAVQLACLDDVSAQVLADMPVRYVNGRDDDWAHAPSETEQRYL